MSPLPAALENAPPGFVWSERGNGLWSLVKAEGVDDARHAAELEAHRQALTALHEEREAEAERAALIAPRLAAVLATMPTDRALGCDVAGLPEARADLIRCIAWVEYSRSLEQAARDRLETVTQAAGRKAAAEGALASLDEALRTAFADWIRYGSQGNRPSDRAAVRTALRMEIASVEIEAALEGDAQFEVEVAAAVVTALQDRILGLRHGVLVEAAAATIGQEIAALTDRLQDCYAVMFALNEVVGGPKAGKMVMPSLSGRPVTLDVASKDAPGAVSAWERALSDVTDDPLCEIEAPGQIEEPEETTPRGLSWSAIRTAWRGSK
jgi:hypothetical protein